MPELPTLEFRDPETVPHVQCVIKSRGRPGAVTTHKFWNAILVVQESELAAYKEAHGDEVEIVAHPDALVGGAGWNWVYDRWPNLFLLDDDLGPMFWMGHAQGESIQYFDAEHADEVVQHVASMAWQAGAYAFTLNSSADIRNFIPSDPFRLSGYAQGWIGLFAGSRLRWLEDPYFMYTDYYLSALNAYWHRILWVDNRFSATSIGDDARSPGGAQFFRNTHHLERGYYLLKRLFGDAVVLKQKSQLSRGRKQHPWQVNLLVPWML
jgi:hypothetical protein